jgi:hypothetical protein
MNKDPFVEEVRAARSKHAAKFGNNLRRIFEDLRKSQKSSRRKIVRRGPKFPLKAAG